MAHIQEAFMLHRFCSDPLALSGLEKKTCILHCCSCSKKLLFNDRNIKSLVAMSWSRELHGTSLRVWEIVQWLSCTILLLCHKKDRVKVNVHG
jgi:hypothetical protein